MFAPETTAVEQAREENQEVSEEESTEELETATLVNITIQQQESFVLNDKLNM